MKGVKNSNRKDGEGMLKRNFIISKQTFSLFTEGRLSGPHINSS